MNQIIDEMMSEGEKALFDRASLKERRRLAMIRAAGAAFNRIGYHNTSMDDIATLLGTSKPTLYQYFQNKQKLLHACHNLAMDYGEHALTLANQADGNGWERIQIFCRSYMGNIMDQFGACTVLNDVNALSSDDRAAAVARRQRISHAVTDLIRGAISDGSVAPANERLATLFILSVVNYIMVWYRPEGELGREEIIDGFIGFFENGLKS